MMPAKYSNKGKLISKWSSIYLQAVDFDRWHRVTEAIVEYERCASCIESDLTRYNDLYTVEQQNNLRMLCSCVRVRAVSLKNMNEGKALSFKEMEQLSHFIKNLLSWKAPFPIVLHPHHDLPDDRSSASSSHSWTDDEEVLSTPDVTGNQLLAMLPIKPGKHRLTIKLVSIGAKHPEKFIQPFVTVSVKDDVGISITPDQDVRWPIRIQKPDIIFEKNVEIQRYLEDIYRGCAVYFELKCYKKREKLVATKCFSYLDVKMIRTGPYTLALFKAPVKYTKRGLTPLTSKPIYLYIDVTVHDFQSF